MLKPRDLYETPSVQLADGSTPLSQPLRYGRLLRAGTFVAWLCCLLLSWISWVVATVMYDQVALVELILGVIIVTQTLLFYGPLLGGGITYAILYRQHHELEINTLARQWRSAAEACVLGFVGMLGVLLIDPASFTWEPPLTAVLLTPHMTGTVLSAFTTFGALLSAFSPLPYIVRLVLGALLWLFTFFYTMLLGLA